MNRPDINLNLPYLHSSTSMCRHTSSSTNSKSASSSTKSNDSVSLPILIQLCLCPDEKHAYRTMRILFSSTSHYSPNVCDEFGCNALMYSLRYQRYRLLEFLLQETSVDLNLGAQDRQGNTILHYAVLYSRHQTQIMDKLIDKYNQFRIEIDQRNHFGFTPLLLAIFCGRYDLLMSLMTKTDASPFVRDFVQLKSMLDYLEVDLEKKQLINQYPKSQKLSYASAESNRILVQLHQSLPMERETSSHHHSTEQQTYKNFFEIIFPQAVQDRSEMIRSLIIKTIDAKYLSTNLSQLLDYLNQRYPRIKTAPRRDYSPEIRTIQQHQQQQQFPVQRENSKANIHRILSLFDPNVRAKVIPPKAGLVKPLQTQTSTAKTPITFKRLGARITTIAAFSRSNLDKKRF